MLQHVHRHLRRAAELARERPLRALAGAEDAAEHAHLVERDLRRLGGAGDLLDLGLAIDREQAHAETQRAADAALLLDGVAEGDAVGGGAGGERHLGLGHRRGVEAGAEIGEQPQHLGRGVRLHGVEHARVGERPCEADVVLAHDVEVEDHDGAVVAAEVAAGTQEVADAVGHRYNPTKVRGPPFRAA